MAKHYRTYLWLCLILVSCYNGFATAQTSANLSNDEPALSKAIKFYDREIKGQAKLFNGREFEYYKGFEGLAYYKSINFDTTGYVIYDGFKYKNVPLIYDVYKDRLISRFANGFIKYVLVSEKVSRFEIYDHQFIRSEFEVFNKKNAIQTGFFDQIYDGKCKILVKRLKYVQETTGATLKRFFIDRDLYFLEKDDKYYIFIGEKELLKLFGDKKRDIQAFMKTNKIKFKTDPEYAMVMIGKYVEGLLN